MKIKRYNAKDMRTALAQVKEELGVDAVIMSNKKTATGIELVAAIDPETEAKQSAATNSAATNNAATAKNSAQAPHLNNPTELSRFSQNQTAHSAPTQMEADKVASSLQELLSRQNAGSQATNKVQPYHVSQTNASQVAANQHTTEHLAMAHQQSVNAEQVATSNNPIGTMTQALSQQAESEFEQWLSKARDKVTTEAEVDAKNHYQDTTTQPNHASFDFDELQDNEGFSSQVNASVDDLATLKAEMNSIKQLLEHQVSNLMWQDTSRREPVKAMLTSKLKDMGLSVKVAEHLTHFIDEKTEQSQVWPKMLELLTEQLDTTDNEIIKRGGVYALVGPTGVGKTTTIAKLAARYAQMYGADKVGLITTDSFRIGALEQLATYAKILGVPLKQAKDVEQLSEAIYQLRNKKLVLIDTAGMSQRDIKLTERLNYLLTQSRVNIKNYLVLSATSQMSVLQESVQHFKTIPLSGCIFTKIDESLSLGELMSVAIHNRLPIGYLTNGQRVPEDIRVANSGKIVQKANQLFELKQKVTNQNNKVVPKAVGMYD